MRTITELGLKQSSAKLLPAGSILLSSRATVGECSISKFECATNQGFQSLIPKDENSNEFIYYLALSLKQYFIKHASGSTFLEIPNSEVKATPCYIPPTILEQRKIGKFLALIDRKIELHNKLIALLKSYKRGVLCKIFNKIDNRISLQEISEYCSSANTMAIVQSYGNGEFPVYDASGIVAYIDRYDFDHPYVAIIKDGSGVGRLQLCKQKSSIIGTLGALFPKCCSVEYLLAVLETIDFRQYTTGMAIPHIYYKDYKNASVPFPDTNTQNKISNIANGIDTLIEKEHRLLEKLQSLKSSLLQQLFI